MILLINTSSSIANFVIIDKDNEVCSEYSADRTLAKNILTYINDTLKKFGYDWPQISAIGVFKGPGSFTGLRIGITVANTIANSLHIPIIGASGDEWKEEISKRLDNGDNDKLVVPFYGSSANITLPKK